MPWEVIDVDWNDHYVRVGGTIRAELTYHYGDDHGSQALDDVTVQGLEQFSHTATPQVGGACGDRFHRESAPHVPFRIHS